MVIAITLLNFSPALIWASARAVNRRHIDFALVGAAPSCGSLAYAMPAFRASPGAQVGLNLRYRRGVPCSPPPMSSGMLALSG